jgi:hypothetical protein
MSRTGDVLGEPCKTPGCGGIVEKSPDYRDLVDSLPEPLICGRTNTPARWDRFKSNGDRVCSNCGSLHPDDFLKLVVESSKDGSDVGIEPSDKGYKVYVTRPSVRNASEGGIKFYKQHFVDKPDDLMNEYYKLAVNKSRERFEARLYGKRITA